MLNKEVKETIELVEYGLERFKTLVSEAVELDFDYTAIDGTKKTSDSKEEGVFWSIYYVGEAIANLTKLLDRKELNSLFSSLEKRYDLAPDTIDNLFYLQQRSQELVKYRDRPKLSIFLSKLFETFSRLAETSFAFRVGSLF